MKRTIEEPDKEIKLSHGDYVKIYIRNNEVEFDFYCDGIGNSFTIKKDEMKKWL